MIKEQLITAATIFSAFFCVFVFKIRNNRNHKQHLLKTKKIDLQLAKHHQQIALRHKHLNQYNFLKYNLKQTMYIQLEINVSLRR